MHAAVFHVTIKDRAAAQETLREQVVPGAKGAPGFAAGYWLDRGNDKGMSVIVFDSQENAQAFVDSPGPPEGAPVSFDGSEVAEVVAQA
jgi:heme-degrading monooxygenase HmoA